MSAIGKRPAVKVQGACSNFEPQKFRPNFCVNCQKIISLHENAPSTPPPQPQPRVARPMSMAPAATEAPTMQTGPTRAKQVVQRPTTVINTLATSSSPMQATTTTSTPPIQASETSATEPKLRNRKEMPKLANSSVTDTKQRRNTLATQNSKGKMLASQKSIASVITKRNRLPVEEVGVPIKISAPVSTQSASDVIITPRKSRLPVIKKKTKKNQKNLFEEGFLALQQKNGEKPNANEFYEEIIRAILTDGIKLSTNHTEEICNKSILHSPVLNDRPRLLISTKERRFLSNLATNIDQFVTEQKRLKKIIKIQSAMRCWLIKNKFKKLSELQMEQLRKRNHMFIELVKTERAYIRSIDNLVKNYVIPIRQSDFVAPNECAFIFSNIESIADEHRNLCAKLIAQRTNWPFLANVGAVFLDVKSLLNAISVYVGNFKNAMNEVQRLTRENPKFLQLIDNVFSFLSLFLPFPAFPFLPFPFHSLLLLPFPFPPSPFFLPFPSLSLLLLPPFPFPFPPSPSSLSLPF